MVCLGKSKKSDDSGQCAKKAVKGFNKCLQSGYQPAMLKGCETVNKVMKKKSKCSRKEKKLVKCGFTCAVKSEWTPMEQWVASTVEYVYFSTYTVTIDEWKANTKIYLKVEENRALKPGIYQINEWAEFFDSEGLSLGGSNLIFYLRDNHVWDGYERYYVNRGQCSVQVLSRRMNDQGLTSFSFISTSHPDSPLTYTLSSLDGTVTEELDMTEACSGLFDYSQWEEAMQKAKRAEIQFSLDAEQTPPYFDLFYKIEDGQ